MAMKMKFTEEARGDHRDAEGHTEQMRGMLGKMRPGMCCSIETGEADARRMVSALHQLRRSRWFERNVGAHGWRVATKYSGAEQVLRVYMENDKHDPLARRKLIGKAKTILGDEQKALVPEEFGHLSAEEFRAGGINPHNSDVWPHGAFPPKYFIDGYTNGPDAIGFYADQNPMNFWRWPPPKGMVTPEV